MIGYDSLIELNLIVTTGGKGVTHFGSRDLKLSLLCTLSNSCYAGCESGCIVLIVLPISLPCARRTYNLCDGITMCKSDRVVDIRGKNYSVGR